MNLNPPPRRPFPEWLRTRWFLWSIVALLVVATIGLGWPVLAQPISRLFSFLSSEESIESFVVWLGWWGPPALIVFNALQIVVAPIPAYALFAAAGFLYGPFWGGLYSSLGTLLGASTAMFVTRRFGRPWAERMVGEARLTRWRQMTGNRSTIVWGLLLLAPVGDIPFFLAGLSQISVLRILVLTLITRIPSIFLITSAASGATFLGWGELAILLAGLVVVFALLVRYQSAILAWFDHQVQIRLGRSELPLAQGQTTEREQ